MDEPAIAVLPYGNGIGRRVAALPLNMLHWPVGRPARMSSGTLADLGPKDHLLVYPKTSMHMRPFGVAAQVSVMVVEPRAIHARHLRLLRWTHRRYHRIFTHDDRLLRSAPNARFLAAARTWVPEWDTLDLSKTEDVSLIASNRRDLEGHKLRHAVAEATQGVTLMGRGYAPFEHKHEGLAQFRFSVVIENMRAQGYFSEKLVDALLCETVPIYWGAPDVGKYFDTDGLIICSSKDEILTAIARADADLYDAMRPAVLRAKVQAARWADYELAAAQMLRDEH
ncbi:hypothetical protein JQX09_08625 [Sulfitobacter pseudonitzschiae]|uniref:Glycosyltransferase family 10 (Fucosyltransferase) n=1 Tax=Pseudosulfitobacter pseudonitzschiae TaxID=1402135 RepID=A0A9Q2NJP7_9RHOB|nr:hypothetical protein [Pseudosulfitobacter pseudonitzschiae]MBM2291974.1 hypothetical protein [Pseudosulfitobacter pseudonitzschiae]MBM2296892.1 hypothetical protein [Pseudosulfitobacter pseudonitzschiae]MBM2301806.1 hypothetical protein [Pseudosulfitobacter pseudonitzschiae]MBM2311588.1 hypothetical protein [Pseudosulfitobacter pseudonitzschiae]MBM2316502.1 hypothetical protein [Pseudosulfitobacter pseudonitzschiae]